MSSKARMVELTNSLLGCLERGSAEVAKVALVNYSPQLIDMGAEMDRLATENERLAAIVNLIDLKGERDAAQAEVQAWQRAAQTAGFTASLVDGRLAAIIEFDTPEKGTAK